MLLKRGKLVCLDIVKWGQSLFSRGAPYSLSAVTEEPTALTDTGNDPPSLPLASGSWHLQHDWVSSGTEFR